MSGSKPERGPARARSSWQAWLACAAALVASAAGASGLDQLHAFLEGTQTAEGSFRQSVINKDRRTTQTTSGSFAFQRPGKFRWSYDKPFDQLIVGDGAKVWVYDRDLNQVIVRKLDAAWARRRRRCSPATTRSRRISRSSRAARATGWSTSTQLPRRPNPSSRESGWASSTICRDAMELTDAFGQTTELTFSDVRRNPKLAADAFQFTPPKGADIVGQ